MNEELSDLKDCLTIEALFATGHYVVPRYQRNYAWGEAEIGQLIQDVRDSAEGTKDYYIGTLVVDERDKATQRYAVIDGQQRHTTLLILLSVLKNTFGQKLATETYDAESKPGITILGQLSSLRINLEYDCRERAQKTLESLFHEKTLHDPEPSVTSAYAICERLLRSEVNESALPGFTKYLLKQVRVVRHAVPENTDLNHYFEVMNTRGEQLEKHEVLKARLMSKLDVSDKIGREAFALVWDACADMKRHVQYAMPAPFRKALYEGDLQRFPDNFDQLRKAFVASGKDAEILNGSERTRTILDCLNNASAVNSNAGNEDSGRSEHFGSVINFPNFLLQVLRVQCVENHQGDIISLDDKALLRIFDDPFVADMDCAAGVQDFLLLLLRLRMLLDRFVVKPEREESDWSLKCLKWTSKDALSYENTFGKSEEQDRIIHLLAMFHVTFPSQSNKHWLTGILLYLHRTATTGIGGQDYLRFLEEYDSHLFFGHFSKAGREYKELSIQPLTGGAELDPDRLHKGTQVHNHAFNRLDYLIWKVNQLGVTEGPLKLDSKITALDKFRFAFRSSVEHHFPRHPGEGISVAWATNASRLANGLDDFGNLCLISHNTNSSLNNALPAEKKKRILESKTIESLKQRLMIKAEAWGEVQDGIDAICNHRQAVIELLKRRTEDI